MFRWVVNISGDWKRVIINGKIGNNNYYFKYPLPSGWLSTMRTHSMADGPRDLEREDEGEGDDDEEVR